MDEKTKKSGIVPKKKNNGCLAVIGILFLLAIAGSLFGGGGDKKSQTSVTPDTPLTLADAAKTQSAIIGELDQVYRADLKAKNPDGSAVAINIQSVRKMATFKSNTGKSVNNVVVIDDVTPVYITRVFVKDVGFFQGFDSKGQDVEFGDIFTQTGTKNSQIIVTLKDSDALKRIKFITIGGIDTTRYDSSQMMFEVK